jgi:hemoglobin-like flavoprotein
MLTSRLKFIRMDLASCAALKELRPLIARVMPDILDDFYAHISGHPEVARLFPDQAITRRAKEMQIRHWDLIATAAFDESYVASVTRVGEMHHRLGLEPRWYIGGYSYLLSALQQAVEFDGSTGLFA